MHVYTADTVFTSTILEPKESTINIMQSKMDLKKAVIHCFQVVMLSSPAPSWTSSDGCMKMI